MIRLVIKNLWSRRRRNFWLLAELILVCIVTWVITDPVVVLTHDRNLPEGFRPDHLFVLTLRTYPASSEKFRPEEDDSTARRANVERMMMKLKSYEGVESVTYLVDGLMPYGASTSTSSVCIDTVWVYSFQMYFVSGSDYFRTMGMEGAEGLTTEMLDSRQYADGELVVTSDISTLLHDGKPLYNRQFLNNDSTGTLRIGGVVRPVRMRSYLQPAPMIWSAYATVSDYFYRNPQFAFRIRDDLSEEAFLHRFRPWMNKELPTGNYYARFIEPYSSLKEQNEFSFGITNEYRINIALGIFFLVNLCLGVSGAFWMQTRTRKEEVGIMLSFGGHRGNIIRMLLAEGWVLTTLATLVGCLIYLQYALRNGLYNNEWFPTGFTAEYWVNHFGIHFLVVSLIVYLILMIVVSVGIWIPAYRISRIHPVEALRDE